MSAEEEFNITKLQLLEAEKARVRREYERREGQIEVKKKVRGRAGGGGGLAGATAAAAAPRPQDTVLCSTHKATPPPPRWSTASS